MQIRFGKMPVLLAVLSLFVGFTAAAQDSLADNMDILRDAIKANKKLLIADNLVLTDAQAEAFWPIYEQYQTELQAINERLGAVIFSYANEYIAATITDDKAKSLMDEAIAIDKADVDLRKKYFRKLTRVIPTIEAARYIQMESKIRAIIRFDLAANVPLAE
jgi:hypothetical protein